MNVPVNIADLSVFQPIEGYRGKLVHTDLMTIAHWEIDKDHALPEHSHPHEQILNLIDGQFELTLDGTPHHLKAGDVLVIPGDVPHSGRAITDCKIIDVWHPCREDYKNLDGSKLNPAVNSES